MPQSRGPARLADVNALVLEAQQTLVLREVPTPEPADDEVLVAVRACGICGSDFHGIDGSSGRRRPPLIMGHEAAGVIAQLGAAVTGWSEGDRVTFDSTVSCGRCDECLRGDVNLCAARRVLGVHCEEYRRDGAFADYVTVPARILYALPDELSFEQAVLIEPLSVAVHAVGRIEAVEGGTAVVVGTGLVGSLVVAVLRESGWRVIGVDVDDGRLALASQYGAEPLRAGESTVAEILARTGGRGADAAFEVVGDTGALRTATASVRKGGSVVLVGNVNPHVDLALQDAVTRQLTLYGSCASAGEYPRCIELIASGSIDVKPLISAVAPLGEGAVWFDRLRTPGAGLLKVILEPGTEA